MTRTALIAAVLLAMPSTATAQVGIAVHGGSLGVGGDLAVSVAPHVGLRVGGNAFPFDLDVSYAGIDYNIDLPSPQFTASLDLFLIGGLRLSGGALFSSDDVVVTGNLTGTVDIGNTTYNLAQVGSLSGAIVTNDVSPYVSIGWGNVGKSRIGLFVELGVAFQGDPSVVLLANGTSSSLASFQADLEQERQDFEDSIDVFRYYPIATLGISVGF